MTDLKLMAFDEDDLKVISTLCQDSVLKVSDLQYNAEQNQFILSLRRFAWEKETRGSDTPERCLSVLHFAHATGVKLAHINRQNQEEVLSLLSISYKANEKPTGIIEIIFAQNSTIRLEVECIEAQLSDMPARWEAQSRPEHKEE